MTYNALTVTAFDGTEYVCTPSVVHVGSRQYGSWLWSARGAGTAEGCVAALCDALQEARRELPATGDAMTEREREIRESYGRFVESGAVDQGTPTVVVRDLLSIIDDLRAEVARLRDALKAILSRRSEGSFAKALLRESQASGEQALKDAGALMRRITRQSEAYLEQSNKVTRLRAVLEAARGVAAVQAQLDDRKLVDSEWWRTAWQALLDAIAAADRKEGV